MTLYRVSVAVSALLAMQLLGSPSQALADTVGGSGAYELRVHTCAPAEGVAENVPGTDDVVELVFQAGDLTHVLKLDNPGNDRVANATDTYRFAWPSGIASVERLQALTVQKFGTDAWCIDRIELYYDTSTALVRFWGFDASEPLAASDTYIGPHPRTGNIWLDDDDNSPASLVRFTDLSIVYDSTVASPFLNNETITFITRTCSTPASPAPNDPVDNDGEVRLRFTHDSLIDDTRLDNHGMDDRELGSSDYYFPFPNPAPGVTAGGKHRMWGVQFVDKVRVEVTNGDSWCFTEVALQGALVSGGRPWSVVSPGGRNIDTDTSGMASFIEWGRGAPLRAGPFVPASASSANNVRGLLGLPLQRSPLFRADVVACAQAGNNQAPACVALDTDQDGLSDAVERGIATDPLDADSDDDGIDDGVEVLGVPDVDYPGFGADPRHKDVFVEVDYEYWEDANGTHSAELPPAAEAKLKELFAALDIPNPDGVPGLAVHLVYDTRLPFPANCSGLYKSTDDFTLARRDGFHYARICVKDDISKSVVAGQAWGIPGRRFYTSVMEHNATSADDSEEMAVFFQYAIFAHELGHTLGLHHGGDVGTNCKPNYPSLMNYSYDYTFSGSWFSLRQTAIQFSRGELPVIDEVNGVVETDWALPGQSVRFLLWYDEGNAFLVSGSSVDFNRDGDTLDTVRGVIRSGAQCGALTTPRLLEDHDDHARLHALFAHGIPGVSWPAPALSGVLKSRAMDSEARLEAKKRHARSLGATPDETTICH